jgi:hypothetical protein
MKGRGISNLKEFFNSSPSPYPLPSRERGNYLIFSHLPFFKGGKKNLLWKAFRKALLPLKKGGREGFLSPHFKKLN